MSYDLHLTRAGDWLDADQHPITRAEWERYAESHPALIQDGEVGWRDIGMQPIYSFTLPDGGQAWLSWRNEHVYVNGRFESAGAIAALAASLHAGFLEMSKRNTIRTEARPTGPRTGHLSLRPRASG